MVGKTTQQQSSASPERQKSNIIRSATEYNRGKPEKKNQGEFIFEKKKKEENYCSRPRSEVVQAIRSRQRVVRRHRVLLALRNRRRKPFLVSGTLDGTERGLRIPPLAHSRGVARVLRGFSVIRGVAIK